MTVHAPFRFAPINRWIYFPDWADLVTHDVPFADGCSGEIELEIRAETPLLVGGPRRKPGQEREGAVLPFQLADGCYAIPPSSLQGMVRSILEIATFGKLGPWIDARRFGIRDLLRHAQPFYQARLNETVPGSPLGVIPRVKAGWLRCVDGRYEFKRCELARLDYSDLAALTGTPSLPLPRRLDGAFSSSQQDDPAFQKAYDIAREAIRRTRVEWHRKEQAQARYTWANGQLSHTLFVEPRGATRKLHALRRDNRMGQWAKRLAIDYRRASVKPNGQDWTREPGRIVLTGVSGELPPHFDQPSKHLEFFFFDEAPATTLSASFAEKFREFEAIHAPEDGRKANPNWEFYRNNGYPTEQPFKDGGWMPIFYLAGDGPDGIDSFGLAYMFKLAHEKTTAELLENSDPAHLSPRADLPDLIFGFSTDEDREGLKRRAAFDFVRAPALNETALIEGGKPVILLGPKPSYFPVYVRQPEGDRPGILPTYGRFGDDKLPYATYTPLTQKLFQDETDLHPGHRSPELAGVKIWPAHSATPRFPGRLPNLPPEAEKNKKVQSRLKALPAGTIFEVTRVRFHNLRRVELGALLWALTFGEREKLGGSGVLRHRLGMGKPVDLGVISLSVKGLTCRDLGGDTDAATLISEFEQHMGRAYSASGDVGAWRDSVQIGALLKAANPQENPDVDALAYMDLGEGANALPDTYVGAKRAGAFLPVYVSGGEAPKRGGLAVSPARPGGRPSPNQVRPGGGPRAAQPSRAPSADNLVVGAKVRLGDDGEMGEIIELVGPPNNRRYRVMLASGKVTAFSAVVLRMVT